jgi:hypothetical protein
LINQSGGGRCGVCGVGEQDFQYKYTREKKVYKRLGWFENSPGFVMQNCLKSRVLATVGEVQQIYSQHF